MAGRSLTEIREPECERCILSKTAQYICLMGYGKVPADIMIIGEAPGAREDDTGVPFVGKAGHILDVILEELGISRSDIYITNVVHCRPPDNRKPKMDEIRSCRHFLVKEINRVKPKKIVTLGDTALKGLFNTNLISIGKERGKILDYHGRKVIATYHPSAANYNRYLANVIHQDLKKGLDRSSRVVVKSASKYMLVDSSNRTRVFRELDKSPIISADVETSSLDPFDPKSYLRSVNLSAKVGESYIWKPKDIGTVNEILSHKEVIVNHGIKFDLKWLNRYGFFPKHKVFCTLVGHHLLDENCLDNELERLGITELGMEQDFNQKDTMKHHWKEGTEPSWEELRLCGVDSDAALRLYYRYKKALEKENLMDLMEAEMRVLKTLARMEIRGFQIDLKRHKELTKDYKDRIDIQYGLIKRLVGDINLDSPKQLGELLYTELKLPILKTTDNHTPSTDEGTLLLLAETKGLEKFQKEVLLSLVEYRKVAKLHNTYLKGIVTNGQLKEDGKLHCNFKQLTKTGRLSCKEPNLQNIPREGDIKEMFISSFPGGKLVKADYAQVELRLLAHYSNDKKLIKAFKDNRDIHRETASKCLHKDYNKVTDEERKVIGKKVNFGIIYQISAGGLARGIGCSYKQATGYIQNWFEEFHSSKHWMNVMRESIIETGRAVSFTGRVRRLYGVDPATPQGREAIRQGINAPVQGGAGDITKYNMMRLDRKLRKEGFKSRVICNVHDEIVTDCPADEVDEVIRIKRKLLVEAPIELRVPLEVEIMVGNNWSKKSMKEVK